MEAEKDNVGVRVLGSAEGYPRPTGDTTALALPRSTLHPAQHRELDWSSSCSFSLSAFWLPHSLRRGSSHGRWQPINRGGHTSDVSTYVNLSLVLIPELADLPPGIL